MDLKVIFVYNADSGVINMIEDYMHKIMKPSTYGCNLCALTYNNFGMKDDWKEFVAKLGITVEFLHKDEFNIKYQMDDVKFPIAFLDKDSELTQLISQEEINECKTLGDLKELVENKVKDLRNNGR